MAQPRERPSWPIMISQKRTSPAATISSRSMSRFTLHDRLPTYTLEPLGTRKQKVRRAT